MTKILVSTDGSPLGHSALAHAQALARTLGAELILLSVVPEPTAGIAGEFAYAPLPISAEELLAQEQELRDSLKQVAGNARIVTQRTEGRSVAQAILDVAAQEGVNMIVMSTHGRSGLSRVLLGSVAEAVVHAASVPVLLIRGEQPVTTWAG